MSLSIVEARLIMPLLKQNEKKCKSMVAEAENVPPILRTTPVAYILPFLFYPLCPVAPSSNGDNRLQCTEAECLNNTPF